jgi:hypothetical protein
MRAYLPLILGVRDFNRNQSLDLAGITRTHMSNTRVKTALIAAAALAVAITTATGWAAEAPLTYPDPDTEKPCAGPGESPECAAKTFWLCTEKSITICKLAGLNVQADGSQHKEEEGTVVGDAWTKPWTLSWTELLQITHPKHTVWQIEGLRENTSQRLRGVPGNRRALTGSHELMIKMVDAGGAEEKQSVFLVQKKNLWSVTGFARWRGTQRINACERRKLGSLACRYTVPGLALWDLTPPESKAESKTEAKTEAKPETKPTP